MSNQVSRADRIHAVFTNGDKPLAERKIAKSLAAIAIICSSAFAGHATAAGAGSNWFTSGVNNASATHYGSNQALRGGDVNEGVVEAVQQVRIKNSHPSTMGTVLGGAIGGALGYTVTQHSHNSRVRGLGTLLGTTLGAGLGRASSELGNGNEGVRVIVRMPDGRGHYMHKSFVQADDQPGIQVGATVAIAREGGQMRVIPIDPRVANTINQDEGAGYGSRSYRNEGDRGYGDRSYREDGRGYAEPSSNGRNTRYVGDDGYDERTQEVQQNIRQGYRTRRP